jgi:hypothetical protein
MHAGDPAGSLVWAVEAVRVHAIASGRIESGGIGIAGLALTYGASNVGSCLLLDAGLPSRLMAKRLLAAFPPSYDDRRGFGAWLNNVMLTLKPANFWPDEGSRRLWMEFLSRRSARAGGEWKHEVQEVAVEWDGDPPAPEKPVRIRHEASQMATLVYSPDFTFLGKLKVPDPGIATCHVEVFVLPDHDSIAIHCFGPGR